MSLLPKACFCDLSRTERECLCFLDGALCQSRPFEDSISGVKGLLFPAADVGLRWSNCFQVTWTHTPRRQWESWIWEGGPHRSPSCPNWGSASAFIHYSCRFFKPLTASAKCFNLFTAENNWECSQGWLCCQIWFPQLNIWAVHSQVTNLIMQTLVEF